MTTTPYRERDKLYAKWLKQSKSEIVKSSNYNLRIRLNEMAQVVQQHEQFKGFEITDDDIKQMYNDVNTEISAWKGIGCTTKIHKKSYREYKKAATTWFNRSKPKIYGNYLFYPLIFIHILRFCNSLPDMDNNHKLMTFLTVLISLFNSTVKFNRAKARPLIPNQTLMQRSRFKTVAIEFLKHFRIPSMYNELVAQPLNVKDKKLSNKICMLFVSAAIKLKQHLVTSKNYEYSLYQPYKKSITNPNPKDCIINPINSDNKSVIINPVMFPTPSEKIINIKTVDNMDNRCGQHLQQLQLDHRPSGQVKTEIDMRTGMGMEMCLHKNSNNFAIPPVNNNNNNNNNNNYNHYNNNYNNNNNNHNHSIDPNNLSGSYIINNYIILNVNPNEYAQITNNQQSQQRNELMNKLLQSNLNNDQLLQMLQQSAIGPF